MRESQMKVLKIEVGEPPVEKVISNELSALQAEVGGLIECVYLENGCIAVVNEEGKINGMQPNRILGDDIIFGPFFICGDTGDDFCSLTDEQIRKYTDQFAEVLGFTNEELKTEPKCGIIFFDY